MAKSVKLSFPLKGKDVNWAASEQPGLTSPSLKNVRPYDVIKNRSRGGPRPALRKLYAQQIGGAAVRIDALCQIGIGIITAGTVNLDAPTPNPMTFATAPAAIDNISITMTATTAVDVDGVEYYFANETDSTHDSGWQESPTFIDLGLTPDTEYTYKVKARDLSVHKNETAYSATASATTDATSADSTPPTYTPTANGMWEVVPYAYQSNGYWYHRMVAVAMTDADNPPVKYLFVYKGGNSGWKQRAEESGTMEQIFGPFFTINNTRSYRVDVKDAVGNIISSSTWNVTEGLIE